MNCLFQDLLEEIKTKKKKTEKILFCSKVKKNEG